MDFGCGNRLYHRPRSLVAKAPLCRIAKLTEERQKDMELQVKNEEDAKLAKVLEEEADRLNTRIKERETDIIAKEREYEEAKKRISPDGVKYFPIRLIMI